MAYINNVMYDSPNHKALAKALQKHKGRVLINSITDEKERFDHILPLINQFDARIIALCMDDGIFMPDTADQRMTIIE
jgi:cobalamin-dependent methionine synthase I